MAVEYSLWCGDYMGIKGMHPLWTIFVRACATFHASLGQDMSLLESIDLVHSDSDFSHMILDSR